MWIADTFALTRNITWNANGCDQYAGEHPHSQCARGPDATRGYAYYGDAGQNSNPKFYAIDLATGASTLLGNAGTLTGDAAVSAFGR